MSTARRRVLASTNPTDFTLVFADSQGRVQAAPSLWVAYGFGKLSPTYRFHTHVERCVASLRACLTTQFCT